MHGIAASLIDDRQGICGAINISGRGLITIDVAHDTLIFPSAAGRVDLANRKSGGGEELGGKTVPSPDSDPRNDAEFGKI
jgi:hypothetical protein